MTDKLTRLPASISAARAPFAVVFFAWALVLSGCVTQRGFPPEHQIVNFDRVDSVLYRGAQPTQNSLAYLASIGVKSVVNLRMPEDALPGEQPAAEALGLTFTNLPMSGIGAPTTAEINQMLRVLETLPHPVFVHCRYGCDRTGLLVACWRIRHGWSNEQALKEAKAYELSSFNRGMRKFIETFR